MANHEQDVEALFGWLCFLFTLVIVGGLIYLSAGKII